MSTPEASQLSKSARKRANKKAREAEGAEDEAPAAKTAPGKENATSNPKAAAKAVAAAPQPEKAAQPKAKGKAAAAPKAEPKAAAPAEVPKAKPASKPAAKPASKPAAKPGAKAAAKPVEEEPEKKEQLVQPFELDDGTGGDWGMATGLSKKMQRSKERRDAKQEQEKLLKQAAAKAPGGTQYIPGMAPVIEAPTAKAKAGAKPANASVSAAAVAAKAEEPKVEKEAVSSVTIKIPEDKVARVIGPKGSIINMIKEKTGIKAFDMDATTCTLLGEAKAVAQAEIAVQEIIQKGYCSLAFDDFSEAVVSCCKIDISNIIGKGGETINLIKKECKVEVNMPQTADKDPKSNPYKKLKISIAGGTEGVEKCKEVINSILQYGHHEITHPGLVHEELEIAEWQYAYIIGTKGSEMRHIQNNYKVKVNIPREQSMIQNVLVVGEPRDVQRASQYIWKTLEAASQPRGRGAPDKAEDTWGDEEPEEDWMSQYMYKRS
mmetsp:Transcript_86175/g.164832  ORF Transcript_86175/g.164832 Transcript_86175/m.164832 type:complete len:491 (-) Transcript_86175:105-1577(-)